MIILSLNSPKQHLTSNLSQSPAMSVLAEHFKDGIGWFGSTLRIKQLDQLYP